MGKAQAGGIGVTLLGSAVIAACVQGEPAIVPRLRIDAGRGVSVQDVDRLRNVLERSWQRYVAMGFHPPSWDGPPLRVVVTADSGLLPMQRRTDFGTFPPTLYLPRPWGSAPRHDALPAHELFHVFEWGYHYPIPAASECGWLYEGMAYWAAFEVTDPERLDESFSYAPGTHLFDQSEGAALFWRHLHRSPATRHVAASVLGGLQQNQPQTAAEIRATVEALIETQTGRGLAAHVTAFERENYQQAGERADAAVFAGGG